MVGRSGWRALRRQRVLLHHGLSIASARGATVSLMWELVMLVRRRSIVGLMRRGVWPSHWSHLTLISWVDGKVGIENLLDPGGIWNIWGP